jgi:hypothetical protein
VVLYHTIHIRSIYLEIVIYIEKPVCFGRSLYILGSFFRKKEITRGRGGQLSREAGAVAKQIAKEGKLATLRLPSGGSGCPGEEDQVGPCN